MQSSKILQMKIGKTKLRIKLSLFEKILLAGLFLVSVIVFTNHFAVAGKVLTLFIGLSFAYSVLKKDGVYLFSAAMIVFSPFIGLLRQHVISYNGVSIILFMTLVYWFVRKRQLFINTMFSRILVGIFLFVMIFVFYGLMIGGEILQFTRIMETMMMLFVTRLYLTNYDYFKKYNFYFIISAIMLVASLAKNASTRFEFKDGASESVSADPSMLSIGLVLSAVLIISDRANWIGFFADNKRKLIKNIALVVIMFLLVVTTSRIGFLMLTSVLFFWLALRKFNPKYFLPIIGALFVTFTIVSMSTYSDLADKWIEKTFSNEKGLAGASTGRANQWSEAFLYFEEEGLWKVLTGYGPGKGQEFSLKYSTKIEDAIDSMYGKAFELHSFYLNVMVEYGLIAFAVFLLFMFRRFKKLFKIYRIQKTELPIFALILYLTYIITVSGFGAVPGIVLGISVCDFKLNKTKRSYAGK